jgi:CHASE3 domain sensor protein
MPTPAERIATLEETVRTNRIAIEQLRADIHSGPGVDWNQSIRGRLHHMQSAIEAADKLADAARLLAREQAASRKTRIKTWQWSVIAGCALIGAVSPYVAIFFH